MKFKREISISLILLGIFIIIIQPISSNITGAVIDISSASSRIGFFLGLGMIIGGIGLFVSSITATKEKISKLEGSVQEAVDSGVPLTEAKRVLHEANNNVSSGDWVELKAFRVRDTSNPEKFPDATSLCRYWGPKEYEDDSNRKLDNLYKEGKIGKTHELLRGSDIYQTGGSKEKGTISMPKEGSRVLHRHWEIKQMHDYKVRSEE